MGIIRLSPRRRATYGDRVVSMTKPPRMPSDLLWRYVLATFFAVVAACISMAAIFGFTAPVGEYEMGIDGIIRIKGSSLTLASIGLFLGATILLVRTTREGQYRQLTEVDSMFSVSYRPPHWVIMTFIICMIITLVALLLSISVTALRHPF